MVILGGPARALGQSSGARCAECFAHGALVLLPPKALMPPAANGHAMLA